MPKNHTSLTEESIVGRQVIIGKKGKEGYKAIFKGDMEETSDKLSKREHRKVKKAVHNDSKQHRKTYKEKMQKWEKHFKE